MSRQPDELQDADRPIYTLAEAARYARTSPQSIARWRAGYSYQTLQGPRRSEAITGGPGTGLLSFSELLEVAAVAAARAHVAMRAVRRAVDAARRVYGVERPFLLLDLKTDGRELFIRELTGADEGVGDRYVNLSRAGQVAWEHIGAILKDLDYEKGRASLWWVAGRSEPIVINPSVSFGRPYIFGRGISTDAIRSRLQAKESLAAIADDFGLTDTELAAALRFELPPAA